MSFFQPNDISGCFLWYKSTSVTGVVDGGSVATWPDNSGSGNNTNYVSLSGPNPTYKSNVLNGYPTIMFSGGGYLTSTHNPSIEIIASSLSIYTVYRTFDFLNEQVVLANDRHTGPQSNRDFMVGINHQTPSSWFYSWGQQQLIIGGPAFAFLTPVDSGGFSSFQPSNQFVLRSDTFTNNSGMAPNGAYNGPGFYFGNVFTTIAPSAVVGANPDINSSINIGFARTNDAPFYGDIAEIIAYNNNTRDYLILNPPYPPYTTAHQTVVEYLKEKYFLGGAAGINLYSSGSNDVPSINSNIPLYMGSTSSQTKSSTLFTESSTRVSGIFPLFVTDNPTHNCSLFIGSTTQANSLFPLYIGSSDLGVNISTLYVSGIGTTNKGISLFTQGNFQQYPPAVLFIHGESSGQNHFNLYTNAAFSSTQNTSLYIIAKNTTSSPNFDLFTKASPTPSASGYRSLFLNTADFIGGSGQYSSANLYIPASPKVSQNNLPLFIKQSGSQPQPIYNMPLFISGPVHSGTNNNSTSLFLGNYAAGLSSQSKLFIAGLGTLNGGSIQQQSMPLYIKRNTPNSFNLFIHGLNSSQQGVSMYTSGVLTNIKSTSLYVGGLVNSGYFPMYIKGPLSTNLGISMTISGKPYTQQVSTLYEGGF